MAYRNPIEDFLGGAFRAVLGPILAPFMMLAMGLAHITAPWLVHHHYLYRYLGIGALDAENLLTEIYFTLMLFSPLIVYIAILICRLARWIFRLVRWIFISLAEIEWKRKEKPKIIHETPSFLPRFGNDYYYPKFKKDELNL